MYTKCRSWGWQDTTRDLFRGRECLLPYHRKTATNGNGFPLLYTTFEWAQGRGGSMCQAVWLRWGFQIREQRLLPPPPPVGPNSPFCSILPTLHLCSQKPYHWPILDEHQPASTNRCWGPPKHQKGTGCLLQWRVICVSSIGRTTCSSMAVIAQVDMAVL